MATDASSFRVAHGEARDGEEGRDVTEGPDAFALGPFCFRRLRSLLDRVRAGALYCNCSAAG